MRRGTLLALVALVWLDYGPISHKGLKKVGAASTGKKLTLHPA